MYIRAWDRVLAALLLANVPWKAVEDGPHAWVLAPQVGNQRGAPGSCRWPSVAFAVVAFYEVKQQMEDVPLVSPPFFLIPPFIYINK